MKHLAIALGLTVAPALVSAATWEVFVDGSGDAPTIQAAIDSAAAGDEVLVYRGTYTEVPQETFWGRSMLVLNKPGIWLHSVSGPHYTILDPRASFDSRVVLCISASGSTIEGFTLANGVADESGSATGGGITIWGTEVTVRGNVFVNNSAEEGGAIACWGAWTLSHIEDNLIMHNVAGWGGGIACLVEAGAGISGNTIVLNTALQFGQGAGIHWGVGHAGDWQIRNNIVAWNVGGFGLLSGEKNAQPELSCNDFWANEQGDIQGGQDQGGNFSLDPLFCDPDNGDFTLHADSPCLPGLHPDDVKCGLIGAFDVGCGATSGLPEPGITKNATWGQVKVMFR